VPSHVSTVAPPGEFDQTRASFGSAESTTQMESRSVQLLWATICKRVSPMLSHPCLAVCLSSPVCDVGVVWLSSWRDQDETWHAGRPQPWPH